MSDEPANPLALPQNPNLEHLKNEAKDRLASMRTSAPDTQLADAQFTIAREYGFASWRALKEEIDLRGIDTASPLEAYAGFYRVDPEGQTNAFLTVLVEDGKLFFQNLDGGKFGKTRMPDGWFQTDGISARFGFVGIRDGKAQILLTSNDGKLQQLQRIDAQIAEDLRQAKTKAAEEQKRPRIQADIAPALFARYAGHYVTQRSLAMEIICEDGKIFARVSGQPRLEIFPESETEFFYKVFPAQIVFISEKDRVAKLLLHQHGTVLTFLPRSPHDAAQAAAAAEKRLAEQRQPRSVAAIDKAVLPRYAGKYRLMENRIMTVTVEDGHIFIQMTGQDRNEIYPESETKFFATVVAAQIVFVDGEDGRISHLVLHQAGREIPMSRLPDAEVA